MVSYYNNNPTAVPFFFPRIVSVFEFMDVSDLKILHSETTFKKSKAIAPSSKFKEVVKPINIQKKIVNSPKKIESLENRIRDLEQKLLDAQSRPAYQPNDDELKAFVNRRQNVVTAEQRLDYLTKVISKENGFNNESSVSQIQKPSKTQIWQEVSFLANLKLIWFLSHYLRQWKNLNPQEVFHQM